MLWKLYPQISDDLKTQLLSNRQLKDQVDIDRFFHPKIEDYQQKFDLANSEVAIKRIKQAIDDKETIIIYGDYDVDGLTASSIAYKSLTSLGAIAWPFIPHREKDGYGLSKSGLDAIRIAKPEAKLILTVDNGIVAVEQIEYAREIGFEVIVTDHHLPHEKLPNAVAIVHSTEMCGAGVIWCLMRKMVTPEVSQQLLELVAIGTIADQISLIGTSRPLVIEGLKQLNKTNSPGLKALIKSCKVELGNISSYEIGHILAPKLNAVGRLDTAMPALKLLCTENVNKAWEYAQELMVANTNRQEITTQAVSAAGQQIDPEGKVHVVFSRDWIPGVIGLIAGRLTDEYQRPSIAIAIGEKTARGSARSVEGVNIVEHLRVVSEHLLEVGGHSGAAGFSLNSDNVEIFKRSLIEHFNKTEIVFEERSLMIEAQLEAKQLNKATLKILSEFEPFGMDSPRPLLMTKGLEIQDVRAVGNDKHLKIKLSGIDGIAFGKGSLAKILKVGQLVDVAYYFEKNVFNGRENLQMKVVDLITI